MKQKILLTYIESGFGHISSMDSIHAALEDGYADAYDIQKSYIMREDDLPHLKRMENFILKQVQYTNKFPWYGDFAFTIIRFFGSDHFLRFFHRQVNGKSWREGLQALKNREPDIIVTNHYFSNMLAVDYKKKIDPNVKIINYNPDCTLHTFWDKRDGIFVVNNKCALDRALKFKFKKDNLRQVTPCVRSNVEKCELTRAELREKHGLPQDKFTVVVADGGYMMGRGEKFAKALIKSGLPITLLVIAGDNEEKYEEFSAIAEGRSKLKLKDGTTLKVYRFMKEAYELYGAADLFLTKGGPNAVLDSIYMNTPVMINYCPHMIEKGTVRTYIKQLHCGEKQTSCKKAVARIAEMMYNRSDLEKYASNIEKFKSEGNGAAAVARIIDELGEKQREEARERGVVYDCDMPDMKSEAQESAHDIVSGIVIDDDVVVGETSDAAEMTFSR